MKKLLLAVLALVLAFVVLLLAHPLWIGPVVRTTVSKLAPKYLGVPARLDGFSFNFYTGRIALDGFALDNPPACGNEKFVTIGHLAVGVEPMSLFSDVIVVRQIDLKDLYVSLMSDTTGKYNFTTVAESCEAQKGADKSDEAKPAEPKQKKEEGAKKKIIIDDLVVANTLVQWNRLSLPLPSFHLTGIGRGANGVTFEAAWKETETKFVGSLGPLAQGLQAYVSGAQGSLDAGMKAATELTTKSAADAQKAMKDVSKALQDGSQESVDAAAKSINEAAKSIKGSVKSFKSLFGK